MTESKCPRCGHANRLEAERCVACSAPLAAAYAATTPVGMADTEAFVLAASGGGEPAPAPGTPPRRALVDTARTLEPGAMVGEYQVTGVIGEGGMGTVYAGVQPLIDKRVAIKVLKPAISHDPAEMKRFLAEARAANRIGHPNIVDIFSFGTLADGSQYYVMEYLTGQSLARLLEQKQILGYGEAHAILAQVLDALEAAHGRKIVHRDLKPENIFVSERPGGGVTAKLLDFGIAKVTDDSGATAQTRTGVPMGTPLFMSPEQVKGRGVDQQSDVYSVGVILYRIFTGSVPFLADTIYDVMTAHVTRPPVPPRELAQVPEELDRVILSCLAKDKAGRPASVAALRDALLPLLERLAAAGTETPAQLAAPPRLAAGAVTAPATPPAVTPPRPGRRVALIAAGVVVVGATIGGGVALWRSRAVVPPPPPAAVTPAADAGAPRLVLIQFLVTPPGVPYTLTVDGRTLDRPEIETAPSRTRRLDIKVEAPGYQPVAFQTAPASDMAIPVSLVKLAEPAAKPDGARRPARGAKPVRPDEPKGPAPPPPTKGPKLKLIDKL
jgi:serine/threonine-protein kinase